MDPSKMAVVLLSGGLDSTTVLAIAQADVGNRVQVGDTTGQVAELPFK